MSENEVKLVLPSFFWFSRLVFFCWSPLGQWSFGLANYTNDIHADTRHVATWLESVEPAER